ncbi:TIGR02300 family protein [Yunchengibacter salinarum]|uniref:TIGR02300 family protein n=1 Tax=Yunchengibacter salinarum TaxID=3133399 RepID=UPI0035B6230D
MAKPEWGTKRTCPKCSLRFYDLQKDDPVTCIECGNEWKPEPVLKSKQPVMVKEAAPEKPKAEPVAAENNDDLETDNEDVLSLDDADDKDVTGIVDNSLSEKTSG